MKKSEFKLFNIIAVLFTVVNLGLLIGYIVISVNITRSNHSSNSTLNDCSNSTLNEKPLFENKKSQILNKNNQLLHDLITRDLFIHENLNKIQLNAKIGNLVDLNDYELIKIRQEKNSEDYKVEYKAKSRAANLILSVKKSKQNSDDSISCSTYDWIINENEDAIYAPQQFEDCFFLNNSYWYGQAENKNQQYWPINNISFPKYTPYLTGLFGDNWSSILERYWLSTSGVGIIVEQSIPLFVKKNETSICLLASSKEPYHNQRPIVKLKYDICKISTEQSKTDYLNKLQLFIINNYFSKPVDIPDERMFKSPIWSTWANFKKKINETSVKQFVNQIISYNYSHSQLEIDDLWQTAYGDFTFDQVKFPNISQLINYLNSLDFRTTLWVHPFANLGSNNFMFQSLNFYEVRASDALRPGITSWWDGIAAVILDTTNPNGTNWFVSELENLKKETGIDSFKFDAGEVNWLPKRFWLFNDSVSPDQYSMGYARMASRLGKMIEVRTGCQTQDLPIFVRMLDKDSTWGYNNGLKSVITTGLVMSILGYPFILPDMIGGNAYIFQDGDNIDFDSELIAYPDYQLYVRWAQLTAFLPSMQFSIPPWHYNNLTTVPVNKICKEMVDLHEKLVFPLLIKYANKAVQTGEPIIRPVWWIDNSDETNFKIADQFLVGNEILVAPIVDENHFKRDIYIPKGDWIAENGTVYKGPILLKDYPVPIEKIPYFKNAMFY